MSIDVHPIQRRFLYNGITLPDVPGLDPRAVRDLYGAQYPELLSAEIDAGLVQGHVQEVTFRKAVGTKGGGRVAAFAREVAAQAEGRFPPAEAALSGAVDRPAVVRTSRAWQALAGEALAPLAVGDARPVRVAVPSDALAPLP